MKRVYLLQVTLFITALLFAVTGCSHVQKRRFNHINDHGGFKVTALPQNWEPLASESTDLAYINREARAAIAANMTCGDFGSDVSLEELAEFSIFGVDEIKIVGQKYITLDNEKFLHLRLKAKQFGLSLRMELYVTRIDNCLYDMQFVAFESNYESVKRDFERLAKGFRLIGAIGKSVTIKE